MKTFEVQVKHLGPIREATFGAAHMNVLCGKNNTGKSFLMHTLFCLFSRWRADIPVEPHAADRETFLGTGSVTFDILDYIDDLNCWLDADMPAFIRSLPQLLCKSPEQFKDTFIRVRMDPGYAAAIAGRYAVDEQIELQQSVKLSVFQEVDTTRVHVSLTVSDGQFPDGAVLDRALDLALRKTVVALLPFPMLLTAERSGSVLYGEDVRQYLFELQQESLTLKSGVQATRQFPLTVLAELRGLNVIRQRSFVHPLRDRATGGLYEFQEQLKEHVLGGDFDVDRDGNILFRDFASDVCVRIEEASSSVRALARLYFYVNYLIGSNMLLMIDEPELNLHPERQRALTRLLTLLTHTFGTGICISTHSDIIIRELNSLMMLGRERDNPKVRGVADAMGYRDSELPDADEIACGILQDGCLKEICTAGGTGIIIPSFDKTLDAINQVQLAFFGAVDE